MPFCNQNTSFFIFSTSWNLNPARKYFYIGRGTIFISTSSKTFSLSHEEFGGRWMQLERSCTIFWIFRKPLDIDAEWPYCKKLKWQASNFRISFRGQFYDFHFPKFALSIDSSPFDVYHPTLVLYLLSKFEHISKSSSAHWWFCPIWCRKCAQKLLINTLKEPQGSSWSEARPPAEL